MPKKVLFTKKEYEDFVPKLTAISLYKKWHTEFLSDKERLDLIAPNRKKEREDTYQLFANDHRVIIHTSYSERLGRAQDEDYVWILIIRGDKIRYARPLLRTKNLFPRVLGYAKACVERIRVKHICPFCHKQFDIVRGHAWGSYYWRCVNLECQYHLHQHNRPTANFDEGLSQESKNFVKVERKIRMYYREIKVLHKLFCIEANVEYIPQAVRRKTWDIGRPENLRG
jgi:hypothetical protein